MVAVASDKVVIGTKFDQPGLGLKNPDERPMSGFDVDVAKYVAQQLGVRRGQIEWKESPSAQRETLIQNDQVKFIVATYSITDARKEKVDFAGPYLIAGQEPAGQGRQHRHHRRRSRCRTARTVLGDRFDPRAEDQGQIRRTCSCSSTTPTPSASRR